MALIKASYINSDSIYGSPGVFRDLREDRAACGIHRVARIMKENKIKAQLQIWEAICGSTKPVGTKL
ncbi:MAG: transposase [Candidatus Marinimicrobia bacterium]|nr:transposase [Candidatus Neomarinimicrobiota bacterium]